MGHRFHASRWPATDLHPGRLLPLGVPPEQIRPLAEKWHLRAPRIDLREVPEDQRNESESTSKGNSTRTGFCQARKARDVLRSGESAQGACAIPPETPLDPSIDELTWRALLHAARERFADWFKRGRVFSDDDCDCCGDGADDFDADELGLDPEE